MHQPLELVQVSRRLGQLPRIQPRQRPDAHPSLASPSSGAHLPCRRQPLLQGPLPEARQRGREARDLLQQVVGRVDAPELVRA